jgi:hypothetical protein
MKQKSFIILLVVVLLMASGAIAVKKPDKTIGINVVLNTGVTDVMLTDIGNYGKVLNVLYEINAVTLRAKESDLSTIQSLPYVEGANPDAERNVGPIDTVAAEHFADGLSTWNLDAINVTNFGSTNRTVAQDGAGVYVAVLDTGLLKGWRQYFPQERIAEDLAICFGGGGGDRGKVSEQPNKWERDVDSHGTHVTSTIIGYSLGGLPINGVAPMATIIPVKVLNQVGWGWSSVIAQGILYVASLNEEGGPLNDHPVVINMSLSGPVLDAVEQAAIDYAIAQGVIIVASAGNQGEFGMGYPGAYAPVISAAASGWIDEWRSGPWWMGDVFDSTDPNHFYITEFSSRALPGQDLDVAGTVALMAEKNPALTADEAETILEATAIYLAPGSRSVLTPWGPWVFSWLADATGAGLLDAAAAISATP